MLSFAQLTEVERAELAEALAAIPLPVEKVDGKTVDCPTVGLRTLLAVAEAHGHDAGKARITSVIVALHALGVIEVNGTFERIDDALVRASSETSGYLLHGLSDLLTRRESEPSPIRRVIADPFRAQLDNTEFDPFLLLSNMVERHRISTLENPQPFRKHRIVSVLIKGLRRRSILGPVEPVYLHVFKEDWRGEGAFALIGSKQALGEDNIRTAHRALEEDLVSPAAFRLEPSGVTDGPHKRELSPTHGALSDYEFNLLVATGAPMPIEVSPRYRVAWFALSEILNGRSTAGEIIMTNAELVRALRSRWGEDLESVPPVVLDVPSADGPRVSVPAAAALLWDGVIWRMRSFLQTIGVRGLAALWVAVVLSVAAAGFLTDKPFVSQLANVLSILSGLLAVSTTTLALLDRTTHVKPTLQGRR